MFFERFKMLCEHKRISPTKASQEIGFSKGSVSRWRKDYSQGIDTVPGMEIAKKIADYFDVTLDFLLGKNVTFPLSEIGEEYKTHQVFRDTTTISLLPRPTLTDREVLLIDAYRQHPELQALVNQALGIPEPTDEENENV